MLFKPHIAKLSIKWEKPNIHGTSKFELSTYMKK